MSQPPKSHPDPGSRERTDLGNPWLVMLFNDEVHTFDEVILQIQKACGHPLQRAVELTHQVHRNGRAMVYAGPQMECERAAGILAQIQLTVLVERS